MSSNVGDIIMAVSVALASLLALAVLLMLAWMCHTAGQWWSLFLEAGLVFFGWRFAGYAVSGILAMWDFVTARGDR